MHSIVDDEGDQQQTQTDDDISCLHTTTVATINRPTVQELATQDDVSSSSDKLMYPIRRVRMMASARAALTRFASDLGDCPFRIGPITALATLVDSFHGTDIGSSTNGPMINLIVLLDVLRANGQQCADQTVILLPRKDQAVQFVIKPLSKPKVGKRPSMFFNQLTLVHRIQGQPGKCSIKLFSNGRIHMTGMCTYQQMFDLTDALAELLNGIRKQLGDQYEQPFRIVDHTIAMINGNYKWGHTVELRRLCDVFNDPKHNQGRFHASYNPEVYPAVNARYTRCDSGRLTQCSVFVFGSGSVVISGGKSIDDLRDAYLFIERRIRPAYEAESVLRL